MPISTSSFSTVFDLSLTPKQFKFTDTFDYVSNGISLSWVKDCFTIFDPAGNPFYSNNDFNNPDIDRNSGAINTTQIALPILPNGSVVPGTYTIIMSTQVDDGVTSYIVTTTSTYTYTFVAPVIQVVQTVDCISPSFVSSDITNYIVDGITPVVVRDHKVYVASSPISYVQSVTPIITLGSGQFYNGLQETVLTSTCTYTYPDGHQVTIVISGNKTIAVDCTYFCAIYCCLRSINSNIKKYKGVNDMLATQYEETFAQVMGLVELATLAYSCGKQNDVNGYLVQIQELADCTTDCGCADGAPQAVTGLGGGSGANVTIQSCSSGIAVTSSTVGANTTWTICLDPALVAKINNSYNTVVVGGNGISVTSTGVVNGVNTYTVTGNVSPANLCAFKIKITYASPSSVTLTIQNAQASGALLTIPTSAISLNYPSLLWAGSSNRFKVSGFLANPTITPAYKVSALLIQNFTTAKNQNYYLSVTSALSVNNGEIYFNLVDVLNNIIPTNNILIGKSYDCTIHFIITTN